MKIKVLKKIIIAVVSILLVCSNCLFTSYAENISDSENVGLAIRDDAVFSYDSVIVIFDRDESLEFNEYTKDFFSGVDCLGIEELTETYTSRVESAI